jgi:hypothetical protein
VAAAGATLAPWYPDQPRSGGGVDRRKPIASWRVPKEQDVLSSHVLVVASRRLCACSREDLSDSFGKVETVHHRSPVVPNVAKIAFRLYRARYMTPLHPRAVLRRSLYVAMAVAFTTPCAVAQLPLPDTVRAIATLHAAVVRAGPTIGPLIWPGFRPDTIPTVYVIPHRAKLFAQWRDTLPTGFFAVPGVPAAGWTDTRTVSFPRGRPIAFLSVDSTSSPGSVLGLALHEQFHALQRASARRSRRFGAGENSMLVATYPGFDVANEAAFALEGRILARALRARTRSDALRLAREFLAVREDRQARLDSSVADFETAAELNEGLAQYAMIRGLRELARRDPTRFGAAASAEAATETALLDSLLVVGPRSIRRRFYATGSAIALLLDRFADSSWKSRLVRDDATLQAMLAGAVDYRQPTELVQLRRDAERAVAALGARRSAQRDSILAQPGLRLVVEPSRIRGGMFWCFFDPQNVLQTASGELLHMRMLKVCSNEGVEVQLDQPVVEERTTGVLRAVVGDVDAIKLTSSGATTSLPSDSATVDVSNLRIEGPTFSVVAPRARLSRRGRELWITPISVP